MRDPIDDRDSEAAVRAALATQAPVVHEPDRPVDLWLLAAVIGLLTIGIVEVYSTSALYALKRRGNSGYFLWRQLLFVGAGGLVLWLAARSDYRWLRRWTYALLFGALITLGAVLAFGAVINGARRWFVLGPLSFQPVEVAKIALIVFLAYSLSKKARKIRSFTVGFVPHCLVATIMMSLVIAQPDLGSCIVLGATTLGLLFVAGSRLYWLAMSVLAAAPVAYHFIVGSSWRLERLMAYFNPEAYAADKAYQIIQAAIAVGSGGVAGAGLGQGRQNLGYMPEGHSDFILAGVGEELGFLGVVVLLGLIGVIVWRGVVAASRARDSFGCYLAFGLTLSIALQALFNTGVVLGVIPAKGITLPLVSYGGTSLIATMYAIGLILSVGRAPQPRGRKRALGGEPPTSPLVGARKRRRRAVIACA
jgi:cell division protein FtsW